MRLTDIESKVLHFITLRGDASINELAKSTGQASHACRRVVDSLFKRDLVFRRVLVNPYTLGYSIYGIWFSVAPSNRKERSKFLSFLMSSPIISYIGEMSGGFDFRIDIYARSVSEIDEFLTRLSENSSLSVNRRELQSTISLWEFPLQLKSWVQKEAESVQYGSGANLVKVDVTDRKILSALADIRNESHASIARRLGIPPTTLESKIARLRKEGVLVVYQVVAETEGLHDAGLQMHVYLLRLNNRSTAAIKRIVKFAHDEPTIYSTTQCVGVHDFELCSATQSHRDFRAFVDRMEEKLGDIIADYTTLTVTKHHKMTNFPFE